MLLNVACVQMNSQNDLAANTRAVVDGLRQASIEGAQFVAFPENALFMQEPGAGVHPAPEQALVSVCEAAAEAGVWALIGSVQVPMPEGKSYNRSILINDKGAVVAHYDKIHLFDVELVGGEVYAESDRILPGERAVLASTPWGGLGMTVCYDVRFPALHRTLAKAGAAMLTVPAAFTYTTGRAHWHVLLRARAIETGCFVIAPGQCGLHPGNRRTYGHSLVVAPWGEVLAEAEETETGIIYATLDLEKVAQARAMVPSLRHDRAFSLPVGTGS